MYITNNDKIQQLHHDTFSANLSFLCKKRKSENRLNHAAKYRSVPRTTGKKPLQNQITSTCIPGIHEKISYSDSCTSLSARVLQRRVDWFASVNYISHVLVRRQEISKKKKHMKTKEA
jgi:hypothetical protein